MVEPWKKYQQQSSPQDQSFTTGDGPWSRYGSSIANPQESIISADIPKRGSPEYNARVSELQSQQADAEAQSNNAQKTLDVINPILGVANFANRISNSATLDLPTRIVSTGKGLLNLAQGEEANFSGEQKALQAKREDVRQQFPKSSLVGDVSGSVLGAGKLAQSGVTATRFVPKTTSKAKNLLSSTAALGVDGAMLSGANAFVNGENVLDASKGGGLSSAVANVVLRGAGNGASNFVTRFRNKTPTTQQIANRTKAAYNSVDNAGAEYSSSQLQPLYDKIEKLVPRNGLGGLSRTTHPTAVTAAEKISRVDKTKGATLAELDAFRKTLGASPLNKPDTRVSRKILKKVDKFSANTVPIKTTRGTPSEANVNLLKARALNRTKEQAQALDDMMAKMKGSDAWIKGRKDEAISAALRSVLNSKKRSRQFDKSDLDAMRNALNGGPVKNLARRATRLNPLENQLALGAGLGSTITGTAPLVGTLNAAGLASRLGVNIHSRTVLNSIVRKIKLAGGPDIPPHKLEAALRDPKIAADISRVLGMNNALGGIGS